MGVDSALDVPPAFKTKHITVRSGFFARNRRARVRLGRTRSFGDGGPMSRQPLPQRPPRPHVLWFVAAPLCRNRSPISNAWPASSWKSPL